MSVLVASTVKYWRIELIRRSSMYAAVQVFVVRHHQKRWVYWLCQRKSELKMLTKQKPWTKLTKHDENRMRGRLDSSMNSEGTSSRVSFSLLTTTANKTTLLAAVCGNRTGKVSVCLPANDCSTGILLQYSHYSWPMTLNKQLPWRMVWASLHVQPSKTSIQLLWRGSVKRLSTTPLNSSKQGKS